jgi:hypothetical protein
MPKLYKIKCYDMIEKTERPIESIDFDCLSIEFNDYGSHPELRTSGNFHSGSDKDADVKLYISECDEQGNAINFKEIKLDRD